MYASKALAATQHKVFGWTGLDPQHQEWVFNKHLQGFGGVLFNVKASDKQEVVRNFLWSVLATFLDSYEACITEDFIHIVSILDFHPRYGGKKENLRLGPLAFAKRDQNIIQA